MAGRYFWVACCHSNLCSYNHIWRESVREGSEEKTRKKEVRRNKKRAIVDKNKYVFYVCISRCRVQFSIHSSSLQNSFTYQKLLFTMRRGGNYRFAMRVKKIRKSNKKKYLYRKEIISFLK